MTGISDVAWWHLDMLGAHYEEKGYLDAARNLDKALEEARVRIAADPMAGAPYPRPYRQLERHGFLWIYREPYWFAYEAAPPVIAGVFYKTADIPGWF